MNFPSFRSYNVPQHPAFLSRAPYTKRGTRAFIIAPIHIGHGSNARVDKVYFGAYEQKGRSLTEEIANANLLNHKTEILGGVLGEECSALLSSFFISMRQKQKEEKERKKAEADNISCEEI